MPQDGEQRGGPLTRRERECLRLVWNRRTTKEIARELQLSPGTVFRYISEAQTKLGAPNRRAAAEMVFGGRATASDTIEPNLKNDCLETVPTDRSTAPGSPSPEWRRKLPIRTEGASHNELGIGIRIAWAFGIAIASAVSFGMLADGAQVVSELARGLGG